jgi:hypothetical protein
MIYLNDLPVAIDANSVYQYCDDSLITWNVTNHKSCEELQGVLQKLENWMRDHHMKINMRKCQCISFRRSENSFTKSFNYQLQGETIQWVNQIKYLGVMISDDFTWGCHAKYLQEKLTNDIQKEIVAIYNFSDAMQKLYYIQSVRPKLEKSCEAWYIPLTRKNNNLVSTLESFQMKMLCFTKCRDVPPLVERRLKYLFNLMFQILSRRKPYQKIYKMLDICDPNFDLRCFMSILYTDDSIVGSGILELAKFATFLDDEIHYVLVKLAMREGALSSSQVAKFCALRAKKYLYGIEDVSNDVAFRPYLHLVSTLMHQKLSADKILRKIDLVVNKFAPLL